MKKINRMIFFSLGLVALLLGIIGVFVPLLPTVPFLILATFLFSKSSDRFHKWLIEHPRYGPPVLEWQKSGVIRKKAKFLASAMIFISIPASMYMVRDRWYLVLMLFAIMVGVLTFIWTRPSHPKEIEASEARLQ